jgi:hypothetical protein
MHPWLVTLTVRHAAEDPVSICRAVRACWRKVLAGRAWQTFKREAQLEWIAAEEMTFGANGWHPHIHALLLPGNYDARREWDFPLWWYERWSTIVVRELGERFRPDPLHGADVRPCNAEQYLSKLGIELTDAAVVKGRSPLQLLRDGQTDRYLELQRSRHRARDITWSRGLRDLRDAAEPESGEPTVVLSLRGSEYERLANRGVDALIDVLDAAAGAVADGTDCAATAEHWLGGPLEGVTTDE